MVEAIESALDNKQLHALEPGAIYLAESVAHACY